MNRNKHDVASRRYHPDKSDLPNAHETFMRIANAYEVRADAI